MGRSMIEPREKEGVGWAQVLYKLTFKTQRVCEINMTECDCKAGRVHTNTQLAYPYL